MVQRAAHTSADGYSLSYSKAAAADKQDNVYN